MTRTYSFRLCLKYLVYTPQCLRAAVVVPSRKDVVIDIECLRGGVTGLGVGDGLGVGVGPIGGVRERQKKRAG